MSRFARLRPTRGELREMARLAAPIVLVNVGMQAMGVLDVMMLGRVSTADLAAGALGNFYFFISAVIGIGVLMALDPVIAQAVGARDAVGVARGVQRGAILTVLVSVVVSLTYLPAAWILDALRQPADVTPLAAGYVRWSILGLLPFFAFNTMRQVLQAMKHLRALVVAVVIGNVANAFLNWILIYGNLGASPGGVIGSAQATVLARWVMALALLAASWQTLRPTVVPWRRESLALAPLMRMLFLGLPIGFQFFAEVNAFGMVTVMAGWMGTVTLAGHEIALTLASMTFMVPMGVAGAAAVMVGHAVGAGDTAASRRDAVAALVCGVGFMASMAVVFALVPDVLAGAFARESGARQLAATLIPIAAVFQVFDGTQVIATAILRGAGDTRVPMVLHILSFWAVGIPLGAFAAFGLDAGAPGLWWGLTAGLAAASVLQVVRVRNQLSREVRRVVIDHHAPH